MKCDWCERPASDFYAIRGYPFSDGCFVRACRVHAEVAKAASSNTDRPPEPSPAPAEQRALFAEAQRIASRYTPHPDLGEGPAA